jgi:phage tail tape-measure protein
MSSDEVPPELSARGAAAGAEEALGRAWETASGLDVGVMTGNRLPTLSPGAAEVDAAAAVGLGTTVGTPTGLDGSAATVAAGDAAERDDGAAAGALAALAGTAVTAMTPTACALVGGLVDESAEAVRLTHAEPLDGVPIPALRVNNDGVTSVPSDPS